MGIVAREKFLWSFVFMVIGDLIHRGILVPDWSDRQRPNKSYFSGFGIWQLRAPVCLSGISIRRQEVNYAKRHSAA